MPGTHHCSICQRCVYKMDHHCPWTNNCVGYLTMKPFLLFLFYVTNLCFFTVGWMYKAAWDHKIHHIGFAMNFIPQAHLKEALAMWIMDPEEKAKYKELRELDFKEQQAIENNAEGFFGQIWSILQVCKAGRLSPLYSWSQFTDFMVFALTLICGMYTCMLLVQTMYYIYR